MLEPRFLHGSCVWKGAELTENHRWLKHVPPVVLKLCGLAVNPAKLPSDALTAACPWRTQRPTRLPPLLIQQCRHVV
jgi:hypothetical protein